MKRIILLFITLSICFASLGQMDITSQKRNIGGRDLYTKTYLAKIPSQNWVVWLPGQGELGNPNGSQIDLVELYADAAKKIPNSWTAAAKNGYDFSFNILAIQLPTGWDYWAIKDNIATYVKETLKANEIIVVGYSLGGRGAWACLQGDTKGYINGIVSVCGFYDVTLGKFSTLRTAPALGVHGDQDTKMPYSYDVATATGYNTPDRPTQIINDVQQPPYYLVTIPGAAHNVWATAFDTTPGKDFVLQWVLQQFGPTQTISDPTTNPVFDGVNLIYKTAAGKTIVVKPVSVD